MMEGVSQLRGKNESKVKGELRNIGQMHKHYLEEKVLILLDWTSAGVTKLRGWNGKMEWDC